MSAGSEQSGPYDYEDDYFPWPDAALAQLGAEGHQVQDGAGEPVEPGHLQRVASRSICMTRSTFGWDAFALLTVCARPTATPPGRGLR